MATPLKFGTEFVLNAAPSQAQNETRITALPDGRFFVTFSRHDTADINSHSEIWGQVFNADGTRSGAEVQLSAPGGAQGFSADTALLTNGRLVTLWTEQSDSSVQISGLQGRFTTLAGTKTGSAIAIPEAAGTNYQGASVVALPGGGFIEGWGEPDSALRKVQIFAANGDRVGTPTVLSGVSGNMNLTALSDGRILASWVSDTNNAQILTADGSLSGAAFHINLDQYGGFDRIAALAHGGFVTSWAAPDSVSLATTDTYGQVYGADGAAVGAAFKVNTIDAGFQSRGLPVALTDGRFLILWEDNSRSADDKSGLAIRAQLFTEDGSKSGTEFLVNTFTPGDQSLSDAKALADGRVLVSWIDWVGHGDGTHNYEMHAQFLDPREAAVATPGTSGADQYVGTRFNDSLLGAGGADRLAGASGDDILIGGNGVDVLLGQTGNDTLIGGAGADRLDGGAGRDVMTGNPGADVFVFATAKDIGTGELADLITDFAAGTDRFDLSAFMQSGHFIGTGPFAAAGDVRYDAGTLSGDVNGNGVADWSLSLINKPDLTASDFIF